MAYKTKFERIRLGSVMNQASFAFHAQASGKVILALETFAMERRCTQGCCASLDVIQLPRKTYPSSTPIHPSQSSSSRSWTFIRYSHSHHVVLREQPHKVLATRLPRPFSTRLVAPEVMHSFEMPRNHTLGRPRIGLRSAHCNASRTECRVVLLLACRCIL